jgi:hypothetical protein
VVKGPDILAYHTPVASGSVPFLTISPPLPVLGGGTVTWGYYLFVGGIAVSPDGEQVWIADPDTHRVFRINHALTSPVVDIVLGQVSLSGVQCNQGGGEFGMTASSLCKPGAVVLDPAGNLYVSDHALEVEGNHRLLEWDAAVLPTAPAAVQFAIPATRAFGTDGRFDRKGCDGVDPLCMPFEPAFDSTGRMVVGMNGYSPQRFPFVYDSPLTSPAHDARLGDYGSMPYAATFDDQDNLYVVDLNRHRVLIYWPAVPEVPVSSGCAPAPWDPNVVFCTSG